MVSILRLARVGIITVAMDVFYYRGCRSGSRGRRRLLASGERQARGRQDKYCAGVWFHAFGTAGLWPFRRGARTADACLRSFPRTSPRHDELR
jgi:hypothetical protein